MAAQKKPTFGPVSSPFLSCNKSERVLTLSQLETPAIFATKWFCKFDNHVISAVYLNNYDARTAWISAGFELYLAFKKQSSALGFNKEILSTARFEEEAISTASPQREDLKHVYGNVWEAGEKLRDLVNWSLDEQTQATQTFKIYTSEEKIRFDALVDKVTLASVEGLWDHEVSQKSLEQVEVLKSILR